MRRACSLFSVTLPLIRRKPIVLIFLVCYATFMMTSSLFAAPAKAQVLIGTQTQITTDPAEQTDPAISGNYIVYTDNRNGQQDIYLHNIITRGETDLTPGTPNNQYLEDIDGNNVVFVNIAATGGDIYLFDIATNLDLPLTSGGENYSPSIDGDLIAWFTESGAGYDVVLADLKTMTSIILTHEAPSVSRPRVDSGTVVWAELMGTRTQIRCYNYASGELRTITTDPASHADPDVSDNKVVWASNEAGNWNIYVYDLISGVTTQLTYNAADQTRPRIDGNNVVWEDTRSGTHQIWFMNLDEGLEMPVYPTGHAQFLSAIDDKRIVWTELRYGNLDIFMFDRSIDSAVITVREVNGKEKVKIEYVIPPAKTDANGDPYCPFCTDVVIINNMTKNITMTIYFKCQQIKKDIIPRDRAETLHVGTDFPTNPGPQVTKYRVLDSEDSLEFVETPFSQEAEAGAWLVPTYIEDINVDEVVNILDISAASVAFGSTPALPRWNCAADVDRNNKIDIIDIARIARASGKLAPPDWLET